MDKKEALKRNKEFKNDYRENERQIRKDRHFGVCNEKKHTHILKIK